MAVAPWAGPLAQTLRDALAFDRPRRILQRDPYTGAITGAIAARAPLPVLAPALAGAFPGRSPRALLAALERGRGRLHDELRAFAAAGGEPPPPRLPAPRGPGSRRGAAGLWDCRPTRPVFYACIADGERLQRSPWGRLRVNPLPRGFGAALRGLIRGGLRPRDAMREAWRRFQGAGIQRRRYAMRRTAWANPGARWHGREASEAEGDRRGAEARGLLVGAHYYRGKRDAHRESQAASRALGLNPRRRPAPAPT